MNREKATETAVQIDGSYGEGGGQILRTSLSLSLITGKPFQITNIRANREKPGLLRQHLTAVQAAVTVSGGRAEGASPGSRALAFFPGEVQSGIYQFAIGTAGSGTLVLQTILPALMMASGPSEIVIEGGTHNPAAPPYDFIEKCFLPLIEKMGPKVKLELQRYGFYPAGGGKFTVQITPVDRLQPLLLGDRGEIIEKKIVALVANLPYHIARRELDTASGLLGWDAEMTSCVDTKNSASPGNVVMIEIESHGATEMFIAFGERGVTAEAVATDAAKQAKAYLESAASVGEHLADQLLLPMALAGKGEFTTTELNLHARTNMQVIQEFLPVKFEVREMHGCYGVTVQQ
jgi:RNA 3'-terminal phosphate cyclase (ATP)